MLNKIDWSKAPEGATHYCTKSFEPWLKVVAPDEVYYFSKGHWCMYGNAHCRIAHLANSINLLPLDRREFKQKMLDMIESTSKTISESIQQDLTTLDTPFGELDRATQLRLVEHVLDGGECEYKTSVKCLNWYHNPDVIKRKLLCFVDDRIYRAVPKQPTELERLESEVATLNERIRILKGE